MGDKAPLPSLVVVLEELSVLLRRLPAEPQLGLSAASALRAAANEGPQRICALAERLGISQPGITQVVDRLVADGLAERRSDPSDRRVVVVHATEAGRDLLERRRASRARALDDLLGRLDDTDRRQLCDAMGVLGRLADLGR